jgi:hypothetical protein
MSAFPQSRFTGYSDNQRKYIRIGWNAAMKAIAGEHRADLTRAADYLAATTGGDVIEGAEGDRIAAVLRGLAGEICGFPDCKCPMDPGPAHDWCARGLPHAPSTAGGKPPRKPEDPYGY